MILDHTTGHGFGNNSEHVSRWGLEHICGRSLEYITGRGSRSSTVFSFELHQESQDSDSDGEREREVFRLTQNAECKEIQKRL